MKLLWLLCVKYVFGEILHVSSALKYSITGWNEARGTSLQCILMHTPLNRWKVSPWWCRIFVSLNLSSSCLSESILQLYLKNACSIICSLSILLSQLLTIWWLWCEGWHMILMEFLIILCAKPEDGSAELQLVTIFQTVILPQLKVWISASQPEGQNYSDTFLSQIHQSIHRLQLISCVHSLCKVCWDRIQRLWTEGPEQSASWSYTCCVLLKTFIYSRAFSKWMQHICTVCQIVCVYIYL